VAVKGLLSERDSGLGFVERFWRARDKLKVNARESG